MKVVPAFLRAEHFADGIEELGKAASSDAPEVGFELGERLFDRVQVGTSSCPSRSIRLRPVHEKSSPAETIVKQ